MRTTGTLATDEGEEERPPVVVTVSDSIDPALTGHGGCTYESPPQSRAQALALVGLLLGRPAEAPNGNERWSCAIAGGRRSIKLTEGDE